MSKKITWVLIIGLLFVTGCSRFAADASRGTFQPVQLSASEIDAAEPVTASAPGGGFYVAWVNHTSHDKADVMLAGFDDEGAAKSLSLIFRRRQVKVSTFFAVDFYARSPQHVDGGANFSAPVIVSDDKWMLQGCPVSGPSLSTGSNGVLKVVWYAAGEAGAPGLYFAETRDQGRTFTPRALLMQDSVKGTPALVAGHNRTVAVWQGTAGQQIESKMGELGGAGAIMSVAANAELPSGAFAKDKLFVAYITKAITKAGEKRSVWLAKLG